MTPRLAALCLIFSCGVWFPSLAGAEASEHDRLDKGEVLISLTPVSGSSYPEVRVRAVIEAPPEKVWPIIDQCGRYKETMYHIKESRELSRVGDTVRCEVVLSSPGPLKDLRSITVSKHTVTSDRWVRAWKLESGDYNVNNGSWTLTRFDGSPQRTLAEYRFHSEPKIWVPEWVQQFAMKHALPGLIEKVRSDVK